MQKSLRTNKNLCQKKLFIASLCTANPNP